MKPRPLFTSSARKCVGALSVTAAMVIGLLLVGSPSGAQTPATATLSAATVQDALVRTAAGATAGSVSTLVSQQAQVALTANTELAQFDQQMLELINGARASVGVAPLTAAAGLRNLALSWSDCMARGDTGGVLQHNPAFQAQLSGNGASNATSWAENVAKWTGGGATAKFIFDTYMTSPGHRANILNPSMRFVGIGTYFNDINGGFNTQNFTNNIEATTVSATVSGGVGAVRTDSGTTVFVRGSDDAVWLRSADPAAGYQSIGGRIQFGPAAVSWGGNRLDLFVIGTDGALYHRAGSVNGPWASWEALGGVLTASPAALSFASNSLAVFGRGTDGQLWTIGWTGTRWTSWAPKGGLLTSGPGAVVVPDSKQAIVGVRGTDGNLYELQLDSAGRGGYLAVGTPVSSAPAYAARSGGGNRTLAFRSKDGCPSVGGTPIGGSITSAPALVLDRTGSGVSAFARGTDNALWAYRGVPGAGSWSSLGGLLN